MAAPDPPASRESFVAAGHVVGGKYRIVRRIGQGGMGSVWEAENETLGRSLALKFLEPHLAKNPALVERFLREARVAATLTHPNVVYVFDVGWLEDGRLPYMAMELLVGQSLSTALQESAFAVDRACGVVAQILDALGAAHDKGIVHRDLKPANVFLLRGDVVKILDFGISKMTGSGDKLTATGSVLGTPSYMAPEQARGAKNTDHRTDLYGVGAILYELLAGVAPHEGDSYNEILFRIATEDPQPLATHRPDVPPALVAFVDRALRRRPEDRFQTAREMRSELQAIVGPSASPMPVTLVRDGGARLGPWASPTPPPTPAAWEITDPADVAAIDTVTPPILDVHLATTGAPGIPGPQSRAWTTPSAGGAVVRRSRFRGPAVAAAISATVVLAVLGGIALSTMDGESAGGARGVPLPAAGAPLAAPPPAAPTLAPAVGAVAATAAAGEPACRLRVSVATASATVSLDGAPMPRELDVPAPCSTTARLVVDAPGFRRLDRQITAAPDSAPALRVELARVAAATPAKRDPAPEPTPSSPVRRTDAPPAPPVRILEPNPFQP